MLRVYKYFSISLLLFTVISILIFFNLGKFLDVGEEPIKSDIIVCLGGGEKGRIKKSVELYKENYSSKNLIILTGDERSKKRKEQNLPDKRIEYINSIENLEINYDHFLDKGSTSDEIIFIKNYLIDHNLSSAIIVSDAPHTRRIKTLINFIKVKNDDKLKFNIVPTDSEWWDKETYYLNKKAQVFALFEIIKLGYTYFAYSFGLNDTLKDSYFINTIKKIVNKETYFYLKEK